MKLKTDAYNIENAVTSSPAIRRRSAILTVPDRLDDARGRVASALNTSTSLVSIESHCIGSVGWVLRCTGKADGTQFFAKILLVDPFPVPPRYATPWEELASPEKPQRPVEEQIAAEWRMVREMRSLVGSESIPAPLGYSLDHRTLVFEEVRGTRLDRFVSWAWSKGQKLKSTLAAIFRAGVWLRRVHEFSAQGCETLELLDIEESLHALIRKKELEGTHNGEWALKAIELLARNLGPRTSFHVPVALNHGDFSLPNLIWDSDHEHLWVVDFEPSERKVVLHDLCTIIFELRKPLLYPFTPQETVQICERAFWAGYGAIPEDLFVCVNALATARLFYHSLPRISTLPQRRGWKGWLKATLYKGLFQRYMTARILQGAGV